MNDAVLLKDLTDQERLLYQTEFNAVRKNSSTGVLLALFLGAFGAHHFYLERKGLGVLYACLCWTLVPGIIAFVEMFLMPSRIRTHNSDAANEIVTKIKAIR